MKLSTKKIVILGVLSALSIVLVALVHFPVFPAVAFLEYDPADVPILITGFAFGPAAGLIVTVIVSLIQGLTVSATSGIYGIIMHVLATGAYVSVSSMIYKRNRTRKGAAVALVAGVAAMTLVMIGANMVVTPYFTGWPASAVWELMPYIAGFNLLKAGVNAVITALLYKRISRFIHRWEDA